jgi:hypothetical protein
MGPQMSIRTECCCRAKQRSQVLAPPVGLGELKHSAQKLHGEGQYPNNKGIQWAICWGRLQGPSEHEWSNKVLQARTKALSGAGSELTWRLCIHSPMTPAAAGKTPTWAHVTTSGRPTRNRYPTGKMYWDPAEAHRGHRELVTMCQHYHQGAAPPTLPEDGQHLDQTLCLVDNYSLSLRDRNIGNVNGVRMASSQYKLQELELQTPLFLYSTSNQPSSRYPV